MTRGPTSSVTITSVRPFSMRRLFSQPPKLAWLIAIAPSAWAASRPLFSLGSGRHLALPIKVYLTNTFHPRQDVIGRLAAHPHELRAHDAGDEVARQVEDFLRRGALETFAKNGSHGAGQRLHFRA